MTMYALEQEYLSIFHIISIFGIYLLLGLTLKLRYFAGVVAAVAILIQLVQLSLGERYFLLDDISYLEYSKSLYYVGLDVFNFYHDDFVGLKFLEAESRHFGYFVNNFVAMKIWGPFYSSTLVLNHFFFALSALIFSQILLHLKINTKWTLLYTFHPFYFSWLQINIKGFFVSFVVLFAVLVLLKIIDMLETKKMNEGYKIVSSLIALYLLLMWVVSYYRFYNSIFLALLIAYVFIYRYMNLKIILAGGLLVSIVAVKFNHFVMRFINESEITLFGPIRYLLSPLPLNYSEEYSFLIVISITATLSLPFYLHGAFHLYKDFSFKNNKYNILWIWFALNMLLYSLFRELQGPRHRMQVMFVLIIFLIVSIEKISKKIRGYKDE